MYARVVRFTGADAEAIEANVAAISANPEPPEGVTATRFLFLTDQGERHRGRDQLPRDRGAHAGRGRGPQRDEPGPADGHPGIGRQD